MLLRAACVTRGTEIQRRKELSVVNYCRYSYVDTRRYSYSYSYVFLTGYLAPKYVSMHRPLASVGFRPNTINRGINSELCYVCALEETNLAQAEFKSFIEFHASARRHDDDDDFLHRSRHLHQKQIIRQLFGRLFDLIATVAISMNADSNNNNHHDDPSRGR